MRIRVSEMFYSFQGEALYAGKPSVWIRLFGCNLECNGFGQIDPTDPSTYVLPYNTFDVNSVTNIEQLPVWQYGCDSSYSWSNKYKHLVHDYTEQEIVDNVLSMLVDKSNPNGLWVHPNTGTDTQLCFTGGEPMMWQKAMVQVINTLATQHKMPKQITIETNATKPLHKDMIECINYSGIDFHFAMSPKLYTVSGEKDAIDPRIIVSYINYGYSHAVKFVANGTQECWQEIDHAVEQINEEARLNGVYHVQYWIMPVGSMKEQQEDKAVADISIESMKRGFNVATRNHCYVFGNQVGK